MENKDFLEIAQILQTNGVGFLKCWFKFQNEKHIITDEEVEIKEDFIVNFSDGKNYLGSLNLKSVKIQNHHVEPSEKRCGLYTCDSISKEITKSIPISIDFSFIVGGSFGNCLIEVQGENEN